MTGQALAVGNKSPVGIDVPYPSGEPAVSWARTAASLVFGPLLFVILYRAVSFGLSLSATYKVAESAVFTFLVPIYYLVSFILRRLMTQFLDLRDNTIIAATVTSFTLGILASWIIIANHRTDPIVVLTIFACATAALGPFPRVVGALLMVAGTARLAFHYAFPLDLVEVVAQTVAWGWSTAQKVQAQFGYTFLWDAAHVVLAVGSIIAGYLIALRRPTGRIVGLCLAIASLIADDFLFAHSGMQHVHALRDAWAGLGSWDLVWAWCTGWWGCQLIAEWEVNYLIYTVISLAVIPYLLLARQDELVWVRPKAAPHASRTADSVRLQPSFPNDANWPSSLVTSLQTAGVRDLQAQQIGFRTLLAFVAVALLMLAPVWIEHSVLPLTTHFKVFARVGWLFATTFGFGVLIRIIIRYLRRVYAHTAEEELKRNDARRPIFYLRSFSLEVWDKPTLRMLLQDDTTAEQKLVNALKKYGPVIAIGRPGEVLPSLGAARFYVTDGQWQQKVADVANVSELVVWTTGTSEGLRWELSHLLERVPTARLILFAHPHLLGGLTAREREQEWHTFRTTLGAMLPASLPDHLGRIRFIYFDEAGMAIPVAPLLGWRYRLLRLIWHPQTIALRALLKKKAPRVRQRASVVV
jgi:hypothetical protein